jgi:hypothetical protein
MHLQDRRIPLTAFACATSGASKLCSRFESAVAGTWGGIAQKPVEPIGKISRMILLTGGAS